MTSLISLILPPPLPIRDPHCDAGTINFKEVPVVGLEELDADEDFPLFSPKLHKYFMVFVIISHVSSTETKSKILDFLIIVQNA